MTALEPKKPIRWRKHLTRVNVILQFAYWSLAILLLLISFFLWQ